MLTLALILFAVAIGGGLWAVLSTADDKATVRASLRQLEGYEVANVRDQELIKPVRERTVVPVVDRLVGIARRYSPDGYVEKVRARMTSAGIYNPDAADRFMALRVVLIAMVLLGAYVAFFDYVMASVTNWLIMALS